MEVMASGALTTVQDLGRGGLTHLGVGHCGAADRDSLTLANRLVGNAEGAAALETTLGGLVVRFDRTTLIAVTGAVCPLRLGHRRIDMNAPVYARPDDILHIGTATAGARAYLAVRGGVDVPAVLGSRSTDLLSGLGPAIVRPGHCLPVGGDAASPPAVDHAPPRRLGASTLDVVLGPRDDWFAADARSILLAEPFRVTPRGNRVGVRLDGPPLRRRVRDELPPEPLTCGAIQVPPDGQPLLFLADHPVTGGYPVIAVLADADVAAAAQLRPGDDVRFRLAVP
ncbi:MAG TPA: biotin-dependent carboxyltransferase family protein [Stackebrandtia sp.]|jgi:biotin-dependent carboxylase-like uncharacterized protein|uniref:5-oxoprolinase subunit C family protein n=1 Tax=Stackebrandtia sp. TaxID=2023065 RepID=UPI002D569EB4|nr:biotin-dependent carboxyltransferase family protein [Stackebrandtia sp.]HZE40259.1 biotin-dependent carboxyltransferase family protein [Stackebrandtia sp.]